MRSRKQALMMAKQHRRCPPPDIADDPSYQDQITKHYSICPYCSAGMNEDRVHWNRLSQKIPDDLPASVRVKDAPLMPGQFRRIQSDLAGFKDGWFYSPPLVLVLEINEFPAETVMVAQTFHDIALAGPEDIILTADQTRTGDLFIECWHIYTLTSKDLEAPVGQIDTKLLEDIKHKVEDPGFFPEWGMPAFPLTEHDPRKYFREMEVETGYFFSSRSMDDILADLEQKHIRLVYSTPGEIFQVLKEIDDGISCAVDQDTVIDALAVAELPEEYYPLAAADSEKMTAQVKYVFIRNGKIVDLKPAVADIYSIVQVTGGMEFSGKLNDLPDNYGKSQFLCTLFSKDHRQAFLPDKTQWDEKSGFFYAGFSTGMTDHPDFRITVLFES